MLVNMNKLLQDYMNSKKAVVAFNIYNLETIMAVLESAAELNSPVILAFAERYISYVPIEIIGCIAKELCSDISIPVVLHLDHAQNFTSVMRAIKSGFTSVMIDGSRFDLKANIKMTKQIVEIAQPIGISVEGELGCVYLQDEPQGCNNRANLTWPEHASLFVEKTNIDALAVAIGTVHGVYKGLPNLDFERLEDIHKAIPSTPLVLHGCSGLSDNMLSECISRGVAKININTELSQTALKKVAEIMSLPIDDKMRFEHLLLDSRIEMAKVIKYYMKLCSL